MRRSISAIGAARGAAGGRGARPRPERRDTRPRPGDPCPAAYPGDDAARKPLARWMARAAALRDVPQELPVMAALAESGLRNLNTKGNAFAGFFSMHRSLNKGAYRGFPRNPELQLLWFLDTAVIVRQREIAEGAEEYGTASDGYGTWIADVERPAPENRDGYQPYFDDADELLDRVLPPARPHPDAAPPALRVVAAARQRDVVTSARAARARPAWSAPGQSRPGACGRPPRGVGGRVGRPHPCPRARGARRSLVVTVTAVDESGNATRRRSASRCSGSVSACPPTSSSTATPSARRRCATSCRSGSSTRSPTSS